MTLMTTGALIAFPAVMPMILVFVGGSIDPEISGLPKWLLPVGYIILPAAGIVSGVFLWLESSRYNGLVEK
jgi:hypothetical protein